MAEKHPTPTHGLFKNLSGMKFGRLSIVSYAGMNRHSQSLWLCRCDCGKDKIIRSLTLKNGESTSCGCRQREVVGSMNRTHGCASANNRTPEYRSWKAMWTRCTNRKQKDAKTYIGRGITICKRWKSFENFLADMGPKPSLKHSIDRYPDNDGNYEPGNCRWATAKEQSSNSRRWAH
jgi:hypothetical protein